MNYSNILKQNYKFVVAVILVVTILVLAVTAFATFRSSISLIEESKRQRKPRSAKYREAWHLLSKWATQSEMTEKTSIKFGEAFDNGNTEPSSSLSIKLEKV